MKTLERAAEKNVQCDGFRLHCQTARRSHLLPGRQNVLIKKVLDDFCSLYTPAGRVLYVSGANGKWAYFDTDALRKLGVEIEEHGKMPDVVVHHVEKDWLFLIEAVTSHGPVNPKRQAGIEGAFCRIKDRAWCL